MLRVFILNGPNLNRLGSRNSKIYGDGSISELERSIKDESARLSIEPSVLQTNNEGDAIGFIQNNADCDGGIVNLGAWTHYNYAIRDALTDFGKPVIEVHLSNIFSREDFRKESVISDICSGIICGFGFDSYILALNAIRGLIARKHCQG